MIRGAGDGECSECSGYNDCMVQHNDDGAIHVATCNSTMWVIIQDGVYVLPAWMGEWMDGWMDGWMDEWMGG